MARPGAHAGLGSSATVTGTKRHRLARPRQFPAPAIEQARVDARPVLRDLRHDRARLLHRRDQSRLVRRRPATTTFNRRNVLDPIHGAAASLVFATVSCASSPPSQGGASRMGTIRQPHADLDRLPTRPPKRRHRVPLPAAPLEISRRRVAPTPRPNGRFRFDPFDTPPANDCSLPRAALQIAAVEAAIGAIAILPPRDVASRRLPDPTLSCRDAAMKRIPQFIMEEFGTIP